MTPVNCHGDGSGDVAVDVRATVDIAKVATIYIKSDVAVDIGCLGGNGIQRVAVVGSPSFRTTIDIVDNATIDIECDISIDIGQAGTTIDVTKDCPAADGCGQCGT